MIAPPSDNANGTNENAQLSQLTLSGPSGVVLAGDASSSIGQRVQVTARKVGEATVLIQWHDLVATLTVKVTSVDLRSVGTAKDTVVRGAGGSTSDLTLAYRSTSGHPMLLSHDQPTDQWTSTNLLDRVWPIDDINDVVPFTNPITNQQVLIAFSPFGTYVVDPFDSSGQDNLTDRFNDALAIAKSPVVLYTTDGKTLVAGLTEDDLLVAYSQTGLPAPDDWAFVNLSSDQLTPQGMQTPAFIGPLVGYTTSWNGLNIAGLDSSGKIWTVWWAPGMSLWRADDLSSITGAAPITGNLAAYVTSWGGVNLTGTSSTGEVVTTWWVPSFGGNWRADDLTAIAGGPVMNPGSLSSYTTPWGGLNVAGSTASGEVVIYWWAPGMDAWVSSSMSAVLPDADRFEGPINGMATSRGQINLLGANSSGDVVRYYWIPGGSWSAQNVTQTSP